MIFSILGENFIFKAVVTAKVMELLALRELGF